MGETVRNGVERRLPLTNETAARLLHRVADRLEASRANMYRVRAYRNAAEMLRALQRPAAEMLREGGQEALRTLPGIGAGLAQTLETLLLTGAVPLLDTLKKQPVDVLATVVGVGPGLARRINEQLHLETLEELEQAAHDGRLGQVPGLGPKRLRGIREALAGRFQRVASGPAAEPPPVGELLEIDRLYRERAAAGRLRRIAPRRFNPTGAAWLPVMKLRRGGRRYRALFSNTARAHRRGSTRDWVVIFFEERGATGRATVTTATRGLLRGRRVVSGREDETLEHYGWSLHVEEESTNGDGDDLFGGARILETSASV